MSDQEPLGRDYLLRERIGQAGYTVLRRVTRRHGGPPMTADTVDGTSENGF